MPAVTVRQVEGEEALEISYQHSAYAFYPSPPLLNREERLAVLRKREGIDYFALFEGSKVVASAASTPMTQNVRGQLQKMSGVHAVVTVPEARRKGYSRRVLAALLAQQREAGRTVSCLHPFRESFYERMGYTAWPAPRWARFDTQNLEPLTRQSLGGTVEVLPLAEAHHLYLPFLEKVRAQTHGMALFENMTPENYPKPWLALARVGDEVVGQMTYALTGEHVGDFTLRGHRFLYTKIEGRYLLLDWIARHIDQAVRAELWLAPAEAPQTWLPDLKVSTEFAFLSPMGRVLDLAALGGLPTGPGSFTVNIQDPLCPWNEGAWRFASVDGHLQVNRAQTAECSLLIQALSALVYGVNDPDEFIYRGWGSPPPETRQAMRGMFPRELPYIYELF